MDNHNQRLGVRGESIAAAFLASRDHVVLARNWRCKRGELDLVTRSGGHIMAVEVKTRTNEKFGSAFDAISRQKYERIQRLLLEWSREKRIWLPELRVDVICIYPEPGGWRIEHHQRVAS